MYKKRAGFSLLIVFALGLFTFATRANGQPLGSAFRVNTYTTDEQKSPKMAIDGLGNAIIVWASHNQDGDGSGIFAQRYDAALVPTGIEFQVNTTTVGWQVYPDVSANTSGEFVVAWRDFSEQHFFQMYENTGVANGDETLVIDYPIGSGGPYVILSDTGDFEFISYIPDNYAAAMIDGRGYDWTGKSCTDSWFLNGDRFSTIHAAGNNAGDVVCLFTHSLVQQASLSQVCGTIDSNVPITAVGAVDVNAGGEFVVVWPVYASDQHDVLAQRYDATGNPVGAQLTVKQNVPSTSWQQIDVALLDNGDFLTVWDELDGDPAETKDVHACRYVASGDVLLDEFIVNENSCLYVPEPVVEASTDGRFLVAWAQDTGSDYDVYARVVQPIGTGIGDRSRAVPCHRLTQISPNPFSFSTNIGYELASPSEVMIRVFDIQGKLVTTLPQGYRPGGSYFTTWNGRDSLGRRVSSGVYFCRLTAGDQNHTKKILVLR